MATARVPVSGTHEPTGPAPESGGGSGRPSGIRRTGASFSEPETVPPPDDGPGRSRWEIVEQFELHGFRYKLIRRPLDADRSSARLTNRERQVIEYALDGRSNKSIAAALGVAPSTIGVLIFRAAAKLGAKSRTELLSAYTRLLREGVRL